MKKKMKAGLSTVIAAASLTVTALMTSPASAATIPFEWDDSVVTDVYPPNSNYKGMKCKGMPGSPDMVCFEKDGDRWWVLDANQDGMSAVGEWYNKRNGQLYRQGACANSNGAPSWSICQKDYYEDSTITFRLAHYSKGEKVNNGAWSDDLPAG
ncbi:hypothetical protein [Streptomyces sp. C36]|uniref:hypothetical protein n=1 Tax=Streptomyces sp. C36 TaxID=3237122 RepID=UPI0034C65080